MNRDRNNENNFERRQDLRHDEETFQLHEEERRLTSARRSNTYTWIVNSIVWLVGIVEILLGIRFFLRLSGANQRNEFSQLINHLSAPFIAPFSTLFISPTSETGTYIFDVNIVIAIGAYILLSYLAVSAVRFIFYHKS